MLYWYWLYHEINAEYYRKYIFKAKIILNFWDISGLNKIYLVYILITYVGHF